MIMSTLALWAADAASSAGAPSEPKPSLFQRFVKARVVDAARRIYSVLVIQSDLRLKDLGYTAEDIQVLRQGRFPGR
jgi:uncharacterized protein YfaQ (DUF2300 family)